jgi:hypothetical protein
MSRKKGKASAGTQKIPCEDFLLLLKFALALRASRARSLSQMPAEAFPFFRLYKRDRHTHKVYFGEEEDWLDGFAIGSVEGRGEMCYNLGIFIFNGIWWILEKLLIRNCAGWLWGR